ncbi:uncharacterized protein VP01_245g2 [Puccinia sorghi]|uniref:Uncharacterized protein n=1 Tax=Puccinia sorghi TaxID=27349 RepID=A0A0L6V651_9BASI|nr:uncharacterized protein VP01_245g2 [Puccinia sorghi]
MEIDAMTARSVNPASSLFDSSRSICRARKLCFRCLKPVIPGVHSGSLNCPNPPITMEQRQSFVDKYRRQPLSTQVSAVEVPTSPISQPPPLAFRQEVSPPEGPQFPSPFDAADMVNLDEHYEDYEEADCATVHVSTVHPPFGPLEALWSRPQSWWTPVPWQILSTRALCALTR